MPFIVKATYRNETRKITFAASHIPSFQDLKDQLTRIFNLKRPFYLSNVYYSEDKSDKLLIGLQIRSMGEYELHCSPFQGGSSNNGCLTLTVVEEHFGFAQFPVQSEKPTVSPPLSGLNSDASAKATSEATCCSVADGKREIKGMLDGFLQNLHRVLGETFGDEAALFEPLDTSRRNEPSFVPSPLPPLSLDTSLHIPGTFMRSRPESPSMIDDELNVEKSQSPRRLEPYQILHPGIWCDFCGKQIKGLRFKCQECPHYDLCANCIVVNRALDRHNEDRSMIHRFATISTPTSEESMVPTIQAVPQATNPSAVQANNHPFVYCDRCDARVIGRRYKCLNCPDFDLCEACIGHADEHDKSHRFLVIHTSSLVNFHTTPAIISAPPVPQAQPETTHLARCDLCESRIVGQRFKCVSCPDFDTCSSCFAITPEQHPYHAFVKLHNQEDYVVRPKPEPVYHFATCDVCQKRIVGVRYKCVHPDCPDFDLCQNCEALPFNQHPATHPMLKLKYGDTYIPPMPKKEQAVQVSQAPVSGALNQSADIPSQTAGETTSVKREPVTSPSETFATSSTPHSTMRMREPVPEPLTNHVLNDPKGAEEISKHLVDKEIQELEEARRRKHDEASRTKVSRPDARSFLEEVKVTLSGEPSTYKAVLERLLDCFGTTDTSAIEELKEQIRNVLVGYPNLQSSLESFIAKEILFHSTSERLDTASETLSSKFAQRMSTVLKSSINLPVSAYSATFISDNISDGHIFPSGTEFVKSWRIRNDGPTWENVELVFVGGNRLGTSASSFKVYTVNAVATGEEADIVVNDMKTPEEPGRYISHWRLRDANLNFFGPALWCDIVSAEVDSDGSHHNSLSNSAVVMPGIAPTTEPSNETAATNLSTPATAPTSAVLTDDSSDVSSIPSVSVIDHSDEGEWDDLRDVPAYRAGNRDEYQMVYDSDDEI